MKKNQQFSVKIKINRAMNIARLSQQSLIPDVQKLIRDNDVSVTSLGRNATGIEQRTDQFVLIIRILFGKTVYRVDVYIFNQYIIYSIT